MLRAPHRAQIYQSARAESLVLAERLRSAEATEALTAFLEKRPPSFDRA